MSLQLSRKWWAIAAVLFCAILVLVAIFVLIFRTNNNPELTLNEAKEVVLKQYKGTIVSAESNGDSYLVLLKSQTGLYEVNVDKGNSGIIAIDSIELYSNEDSDPSKDSPLDEEPPVDSGNSLQPPPSNTQPTNPAVLLTEDEAVKLASGKVDGTVTDVDIENEQGRWYYFVEIETADGREAVIQLNAASGAIISVTWDDDDDDDDEDEDSDEKG